MSYLNPRAIAIDTPMPPPAWALMEWELIRAQTRGCTEFFAKYFDERGYLECIPRWGGNDGPDDAIENLVHWPPRALRAGRRSPSIRYVPVGMGGASQAIHRGQNHGSPLYPGDGMYYREFPVMFDWVHNGEGLTTFNLHGLMNPREQAFEQRVRRFAGFYMGDDPQAPNYDPEHKIIKSLFNGSRGPLLRKATALDWAGDPLDEVQERFIPLHGERNFEEMLAHFKDYTDVVGDHPQNMVATALGLNAYALTGEDQYKNWVLEYVEAWRQRTLANDGIIPTNIGLDGTIGGECDGKWYGGCYGWAFTVEVPQTGAMSSRNTHGAGDFGLWQRAVAVGRAAVRRCVAADDRQSQCQRKRNRRSNDVPAYARRRRLVRVPIGKVRTGSSRGVLLVDGPGRSKPAKRRQRLVRLLGGGRDLCLPGSGATGRLCPPPHANGEGCAATQTTPRHPAVGTIPNPFNPSHPRRTNPTHVGRADAAPRLAAALPGALLRSASRASGNARGA